MHAIKSNCVVMPMITEQTARHHLSSVSVRRRSSEASQSTRLTSVPSVIVAKLRVNFASLYG
jgi:hypothetical protein